MLAHRLGGETHQPERAPADGVGEPRVLLRQENVRVISLVPGGEEIVYESGGDLFRLRLGVDTVGTLPQGLPVPSFPWTGWSDLATLADRARELADRRKAEPIGVFLETPMTLRAGPESELGNLLTDALREFTKADIAIHNVRGGIRAELPAGELTYGSLYRMYPFDNRIAVNTNL